MLSKHYHILNAKFIRLVQPTLLHLCYDDIKKCLWFYFQLIWSMEYNPHMFSKHESDGSDNKTEDAAATEDLMRYGKFERRNIRASNKDAEATLAIFLVASVLEAKNKKLLTEAKGLDDVVKVIFCFSLILHFLCQFCTCCSSFFFSHYQNLWVRFWMT